MLPIIENLKQYWDLATNRYEVFPATDPADVTACMKVLEEVRQKELNRVAGTSVLESHAFSGGNYTLMACRDTNDGAIIGCMRLTPASEVIDVPTGRAEYSLDNIPDEHLKRLYVFTRLAVLKPYRKTPAAMVLMGESMIYLVGKGAMGALLACEPNLYTMYMQIGMRPIGPLHNSPSGGYRIPMIFLLDEEYLKLIDSPAVRWMKRLDATQFEPVNRWFREWYQQYNAYHFGISMLADSGVDPRAYEMLTKGLSAAGRKALLKNALVIQCQEDDLLIAEEDGGKGLGIVLDGKIGVVFKGKDLLSLEPGALFGEVAFVLDTRRTARLVAKAPDTRVLLLSPSAYRRLNDEYDKKCLWRNLAKVLAHRLLTANKLLT